MFLFSETLYILCEHVFPLLQVYYHVLRIVQFMIVLEIVDLKLTCILLSFDMVESGIQETHVILYIAFYNF